MKKIGTATVIASHGLPVAARKPRKDRAIGELTEKDFMAQIVALAKLQGWLVYHTHDSRRSAPGFPDLVLVRGQSVLFWEVKTETGAVSPDQAAWLRALDQAGQDAAVVRPSHWDWIQQVLTGALPER